MKLIYTFIGLLAVGVVGFYAFNSYIYNEKQADPTEVATEVMEEETMTEPNPVTVTPISHATMVLNVDGINVYVDPVGGAEAFAGQPSANIVLMTDIHGDHLSTSTLEAVVGAQTTLIVPQAVKDLLPETLASKALVMANDEVVTEQGLVITAMPMYNVPETDDSRHAKGRGNGYIVEVNDTRVYIAGDTGPIPEMKALTGIDMAFIPMNLPYTMGVEEAAQAVVAFAPAQVYPYHYRQPDGFADVEKFKTLVSAANPNIEVVLLPWYTD
ncbi:MBL fold metallo-hydrolase [Patescibacteria group bacterium]|nr:MBL fold metallo-hydrolase [Patescibacteria group bacterium]